MPNAPHRRFEVELLEEELSTKLENEVVLWSSNRTSGPDTAMNQFFLSDNEWRKAQEYRADYYLHFWGGVDLARDPATEYATLRAEGYPLIIRDPVGTFAGGDWTAEPVRWRVSRV